MTVRNQIRLIVYRIHEKGLEVLLLKPNSTEGNWILLNGDLSNDQIMMTTINSSIIELEGSDAKEIRTIAIEADWHELPRVRQLIKQDIILVKDVLKNKIPVVEDSAYVAFKEAFKKMLPQEYAMLKELKDILLDRNSVKNI